MAASRRLWRLADGCGGEVTAVAASRRLWRRADGCGGEQTAVAAEAGRPRPRPAPDAAPGVADVSERCA